jgi:hypothetical protein
MTDLRTKPLGSRNWRAHLTPEERAEMVELDRAIAHAKKMAQLPRERRERIQNRATQRAIPRSPQRDGSGADA